MRDLPEPIIKILDERHSMDRRQFMSALALQMVALGSFTSCSITKRNTEDRKVVTILPDSVIYPQAESAYKQQLKSNRLSTNSKHTAIVQRATQRLIASSHKVHGATSRNMKWEVVLFDDPKTPNAWAMPGGKMAIYTGLFKVCENEAGLANVIGHEMGHVLNRHGNERISQQLMVNGLLLLGAYALGKNKKMDKNIQKAILMAAGAGATLGLLKYSRKHEEEADKKGIELMAMSGYSPSESPKIWRRMEQKYGKGTPSFLSTHPSHGDRNRRLTSMVPQMQNVYNSSPQKYGVGESLLG